jgi:uncharacterized protein
MSQPASTGTKGRRSPPRLALVTGASSGLGAAFARAYARRGLDVALTARRADRLEALAAELKAEHGVEAFAIPADLARFDGHAPVLAALAERDLCVDVLINNAGFGIPEDFIATPWSRQRDFLMTMAVAPCGLAHAVIPGMVGRGGGAIINVASLAAFSPGVAGNSLYPAVKSLLIKFSQSLDAEYRARGVKVTALAPGFTRTEFAEAAGIQQTMESHPRVFWQSAEQVVETAIRANEAGRVVVVPGAHNKLAALMLRRLPEGLVRRVISAGSARYRVKESA